MQQPGFQPAHVIGDHHHRTVGDGAQVVQSGDVDPAAAALDQTEVAVRVVDLCRLVEAAVGAEPPRTAEDAEDPRVKIPAAAEEHPEDQ